MAGTLRLVEEPARAIGHAAALPALSMRNAALYPACGADVWRQRVAIRMPPSLFGRPTEIALASAVVAKARARNGRLRKLAAGAARIGTGDGRCGGLAPR